MITYATIWGVFWVMHILLGHVCKLYDKTKWFDLVLHFLGGMLIASTCFRFFATDLLSPVWSAFFVFTITVSVGVFWEFGEYASDKLFNTNAQRWKDGYNAGLADSMTDLISNTFGAILLCTFHAINNIYFV